MENLSVQEIVQLTIRVANFMEWHFAVWGCIGWTAAFYLYWLRIKEGGKQWI